MILYHFYTLIGWFERFCFVYTPCGERLHVVASILHLGSLLSSGVVLLELALPPFRQFCFNSRIKNAAHPPRSPCGGNHGEGETPAGGGKSSAAVCRQASLNENRRARFGQLRCPRLARPDASSANHAKRTAQNNAPPLVRQKSVGKPVCSPLEARCASVSRPSIASPSQVRRAAAHLGMSQIVGIRRMPARRPSVRSPLPVRRASVQSPCFQTNLQDMLQACPSPVRTKPVCVRERRRSEGRTRGKRRRDAAHIRPRRERNARPPRTSSERRPCKGRVPSRICPSLARRKPVLVRHASIARTTNGRGTNRQTTERRREHSAPLFPLGVCPSLVRSKSV